jgi:hypothetical protein
MKLRRIQSVYFARKIKAKKESITEKLIPDFKNLIHRKEVMGNLNANEFYFESNSIDSIKREDLYFYGKQVSFIGTRGKSLHSYNILLYLFFI